MSDGTHTSNADIRIELKEDAQTLSGAASTSGGGCATVKLLSQGEENKGVDPRQAIFFLALMFLPIFLTQRWRRHLFTGGGLGTACVDAKKES